MIKVYEDLNEKVYRERLSNGLDVIIVPKMGFKKVFACFATKYGALMNRFVPYGEREYLDVPLGIAHFLEHKMFEMPNGDDASDLFARLGLDSNASTNYTMTAYLFSGTTNIQEGLNLLLDFVQTPHFTPENVAREQGIIAQELKMYLDDPHDALHLGLMNNFFKYYPLRYDIGGTLDSIQKINVEYLYQCYHTFYHPSNMSIIIVGDTDRIMGTKIDSVHSLFQLIKNNQDQKEFQKPLDIRKNILLEDATVNKTTGSAKMDIAMPKVAVGLKLPFEKFQKNEAMMLELKLKVLLEATIGSSTDAYQEMIDLELINGNIYYDVYIDGLCGFIKIQANTNKPKLLIKYLREKLLSLNHINLEEEVFNRFKKSVLGNFLRALNSLEFIGYTYLEYAFKEADLFEAISLFTKLDISDLKVLEKYFQAESISDYTILPKKALSF
jgi:predicted Zn-dependent peptidase